MKRASIYTMAVAGFGLSGTPAAYAREIISAGPESDLRALNADMHAAYARLKVDVEAQEGPPQNVVGEAARKVAGTPATAPGLLARLAARAT